MSLLRGLCLSVLDAVLDGYLDSSGKQRSAKPAPCACFWHAGSHNSELPQPPQAYGSFLMKYSYTYIYIRLYIVRYSSYGLRCIYIYSVTSSIRAVGSSGASDLQFPKVARGVPEHGPQTGP